MGISTISLKRNGATKQQITKLYIDLLNKYEVIESSTNEKVIEVELDDIEIGEKGSNKTIVRFASNDFLVFEVDENKINIGDLIEN